MLAPCSQVPANLIIPCNYSKLRDDGGGLHSGKQASSYVLSQKHSRMLRLTIHTLSCSLKFPRASNRLRFYTSLACM